MLNLDFWVGPYDAVQKALIALCNTKYLRIKKYPMGSILYCHGGKNKEENKLCNNLVIFILEACGAFAMKNYDDIIQKGLC